MGASRVRNKQRRRSRAQPYEVNPHKIKELDDNLGTKWNKAETTLPFEDYRNVYWMIGGRPDLLLVNNREMRLWQAHYMSCFGKGNSSVKVTELARTLAFVTEAAEFYKQLVEDVRVMHGLSPEVSDGWDVQPQDEKLIQARNTCSRLLIRCGDLARYRELFINGRIKGDFSAAALLYKQASEAAYWNGNPHNQMAVLTVDKDLLESMYHCFRGMFAASPAEIGHRNYKLIVDSVNQRANAAKREDWTFPVTFCHVVVRALLSKSEMVPDSLLDKVLQTVPREVETGMYMATVLIVCVEDALRGIISKDVWPVPNSYLLYLLQVVFKFLVRLSELADQALPALALLLVWLVRRTDLVTSSEALKESYCSFVEKDAPVSAIARELRGHDLSSLPDEMFLCGFNELWEDKLLRGFSLLPGREFLEIGNGHSCNIVRLRRIQAVLRIMSRGFPDKNFKLDENGGGEQALEVPPDHMLICTQEEEHLLICTQEEEHLLICTQEEEHRRAV